MQILFFHHEYDHWSISWSSLSIGCSFKVKMENFNLLEIILQLWDMLKKETELSSLFCARLFSNVLLEKFQLFQKDSMEIGDLLLPLYWISKFYCLWIYNLYQIHLFVSSLEVKMENILFLEDNYKKYTCEICGKWKETYTSCLLEFIQYSYA